MRRNKNTLKRSTRVFLNDLNQGKAEELRAFLYLCHDALQYLIDLFWARGEMTASFADLETVHLAKSHFGINTRLAQALAKQAMEIVASQRKKPARERKKPSLRRHVVTLFYHFLKLEEFRSEELICSDGVARSKGFGWKGKIPGRRRSTVRPAVDGTSEIAEVISFAACFVAIPIMPTSKPRKLWSFWDWRESMVSVRCQA